MTIRVFIGGRTIDIEAEQLKEQATVLGRLLGNRVTGKLYKCGFNAEDHAKLESLWLTLHGILDGRPKATKLTCVHCHSDDVSFYNGGLGYEAIRCNKCSIETDAHDSTNYCARTDRTGGIQS